MRPEVRTLRTRPKRRTKTTTMPFTASRSSSRPATWTRTRTTRTSGATGEQVNIILLRSAPLETSTIPSLLIEQSLIYQFVCWKEKIDNIMHAVGKDSLYHLYSSVIVLPHCCTAALLHCHHIREERFQWIGPWWAVNDKDRSVVKLMTMEQSYRWAIHHLATVCCQLQFENIWGKSSGEKVGIYLLGSFICFWQMQLLSASPSNLLLQLRDL